MKVICGILLIALCPFSALAQEAGAAAVDEVYSNGGNEVSDNAASADDVYLNGDSDGEYLNGMVPVASFTPNDTPLPDSLNLPNPDYSGATAFHYGRNYNYLGGYGLWSLHEGLNASLDLSAFTSFGKGHFSGIGERIDLMYAKPLNDKLSIAVGGYFENLNSGIGSYRAAGITALLDYRFNEHWEAYVYGQKNLMFNASEGRFGVWNGMGAYDYYGNFADRIGLGLRYNFNETTFLEVQFDFERRPDTFHQNIINQNPMPPERRQGRDLR
ncbi:MAG: hypothetical protein LUI08_05185 [Prevotella sp.]|nr:hypothetical protein [Prevotella sp.]